MSKEEQQTTVPTDVTYQPQWLTWVASTTACLNALGVECDHTDVAGMSGYAAHIAMHPQTCPSSPTVLEWRGLDSGINALGRSTVGFAAWECHTGEARSERTTAHCRAVFEIARREVEAGRPCVIWGAYVPEFAVVVGIDEDAFVVKSFRGAMGMDEPPVPFDALEAPGGPYVLAFPTATEFSADRRARTGIIRAIECLTPPVSWPPYRHGAAAYGTWITALESGEAIEFGNAYCAQCYAEARGHARDFMRRLADRHPLAREPLLRAAEGFAGSADALADVAKLFPFTGPQASGKVTDPDKIAEASTHLRRAQEADAGVTEWLHAALSLDRPA